MKKGLMIFLIFHILVLLEAENSDLLLPQKSGKYYLVSIGIDKYQNWEPLINPVRDAEEVKDILLNRYYFDDVLELYNRDATKANILKLFEKLQNTLQPNDSLLIFYAGHGHLDEKTNTGFWIPVNGGKDVYEQNHWLPNAQIRGLIANMKAKHIFLISDSCFSGEIMNLKRGLVKITPVKESLLKISREVLTSGASENVPDNSSFARALKSALRNNKKSFLDPLTLYNQIRLSSHSSTPLFSILEGTGHQVGGSFMLFLKDSEIDGFGSIAISSSVNAKIYLDDFICLEVKDGILKLNDIRAGEHTLKIVYENGQVMENTVSVKKDHALSLELQMNATSFSSVYDESNYLNTETQKKFPEFTTSYGMGITLPVFGTEKTFFPGYTQQGSLTWNFLDQPWGSVGAAFLTGFTSEAGLASGKEGYNLTFIPFCLNLKYTTPLSFPVVFSMEAGGGAGLSLIHYDVSSLNPEGAPYWFNVRPILSASISGGIRLSSSMELSFFSTGMIMFYKESLFAGITPGVKLNFNLY